MHEDTVAENSGMKIKKEEEMKEKLTPKRKGYEIGIRTFTAKSKTKETFLVIKTGNEFHVFTEVEAKEAARACGSEGKTTRIMWEKLWKK